MAPRTAPTPWALTHKDEDRAFFVTASQTAATDTAQAAERDEQWHTARLIRKRYRWPESWLDCVGLDHVPADPAGWCTCPEGGGS